MDDIGGFFFGIFGGVMEVIKDHGLLVMWEEIPLDLFTPVSAFFKLQKIGARCLLESVERGENLGRYSFIGLSPERKIVVKGSELITTENRRHLTRGTVKEVIDSLLQGQQRLPLDEVPFTGGWAGYIGYDFVNFLEEIDLPEKNNSFPVLFLYQFNNLLIFDHVKNTGKILLIGEEKEKKEIEEKLNSIREALRFPGDLAPAEFLLESNYSPILQPSLSQEDFVKCVQKAKDYIRAGDIFQVVLSIQFQGGTTASPFDIYRTLRMLNPSPYMFYFDFGDFQLIGSSPEAHMKVTKNKILLRPIAGTRKRGSAPNQELELEKELRTDPKEQAEHVMLVDLARNDLGKVCRPGTVRVSEFMTVEKYSHVMHLVSQVEGELKPDQTFFDLLQATFPAGTVTGAPKLRAMEIIKELEPVNRGPYAGIVGYLSYNGQVDSCIGIRMIVFQKGKFYLQAGAGVVIGSDPQKEYQEVRNKIRGMYQAIKLAEQGGPR
jgi:anthranilate synthase component 1